jgi:hypothetical protein
MASPSLSADQTDFSQLLPLLVSTYQRGHLVPFLGAGMSAERLTLWPEFLAKLEEEAGITPPKGDCTGPKEAFAARAEWASTVIQNRRGREDFLKAVRRALERDCPNVPLQTQRLGAIPWPLVISTNYDDLFFYSSCCNPKGPHYANDDTSVQILGRSAKDCKLAISSLTGPFDRQYIWHVQGFLGGQYDRRIVVKNDVPNQESLSEQLVIGHAEYRAVTNRAPYFRRCFGEVFNLRSFLFLGTSLTEDYFLNLFGEMLDLCGPSAVPHFALTKKGQVDKKFLADQMNITVCEFEDWPVLPEWLELLKSKIGHPGARSTRRSFKASFGEANDADVDVVLDEAPLQPGDDEAVAFVTQCKDGIPGDPKNSFGKLDIHSARKISDHVFQLGNSRVYAVTARLTGAENEAAVYRASIELLDQICKTCISTLHLQMSHAGGSVPPVFGFIEALRTYADWKWEERRNGPPPDRAY